jgi:hypothetical protein
VAIAQPFGAALNMNVHALVLDGVSVEDGCGVLRFHTAAPPPDEEMDRLIAAIDRRIHRLLVRRGVMDDLEKTPPMHGASKSRCWLASRPPPCRDGGDVVRVHG